MKSRNLWGAAQIGLLVVAASMVALAQNPRCERLSGVINAYSPQTTTTGPYEVRGPWSMKVNRESGKADFSAALNMELSDGWAITKNGGDFDPDSRGAHTHHITVIQGEVTLLAGGGFQVYGPAATVTLNGNTAPVSPTPLLIVVTGGSIVEYSNIALTFGSPGSNHFGNEPLPGVVRHVKKER